MKVLVGTHAFHLHLVDFDPSTSTLRKINDIKLKEQPSYVLQHPVYKDLFYVTAWVDSIIYVMQVDAERGEFKVRGQAESGGGGPTHFVLSPDGESLIIANVSDLSEWYIAELTICVAVSIRTRHTAGRGSIHRSLHLGHCRKRGYPLAAILRSNVPGSTFTPFARPTVLFPPASRSDASQTTGIRSADVPRS